MKELYAKKRRENRFRFGWVLLLLCALVWMIEGGVWPFVLGAAAIFLATVERAKAYANVPMPSMYTKEEGLAYWTDWFKKGRNTPSFGESVRDGKFAVVEYFWRIYIGMIPAILLCMVLYGVVAWRILLPWSMIIPAIAAFDVIPVVGRPALPCVQKAEHDEYYNEYQCHKRTQLGSEATPARVGVYKG